METFLLEQVQHIPFLLPHFEWQEIEYLSSCSRRLAASRLRDVFFQHSLVVVPPYPQSDDVVRRILRRLSVFARHIAVSNPNHLALLHRLPLLSMLRVAKPNVQTDEDTDDDTEPIHLAYENVLTLWSMSTVVQLELDAWVQDLLVLFRDMTRLHSLDLVFRYHIGSINMLAHLQRLHSLSVRGERLDDISGVGSLTNLETLVLSSWGVHDITPLGWLVQLEMLDLTRCNVMDLAPLTNLSRLRCLRLEETPVENLNPLANLASLQFLSLARSRASDLTPLAARASSLHHLDLSGCTLARVGALRYLQQLEVLRLHKTTWSCFGTEPNVSATLECLHNLRNVDGRVNALFATHPEGIHTRLELVSLQRMQSLEYLELTGDSLSGRTSALALPHLVWLRIEWNYTREADIPLGAVVHPRLRALHLVRLRLRNLRNLRFAPQLEELRLIDVYLEDFSMLRLVPNLTHFEFTCAMITSHYAEDGERPDTKALTHLQKLTYLDLSYCSVGNVQPLQSLQALRFVDLSWTDVADVSPLSALCRLECIRLRGTQIMRFDGGAFCHTLRELALPEHVDCRVIRAYAPLLRRLLHPDRDCLWAGHDRDGEQPHQC